MQNIHVKRYSNQGLWAGTVEPEDRGWVVFIAADGEATFWRRIEVVEDGNPSGKTEHVYIDAELPRGVARVLEDGAVGPMLPTPEPTPDVGPLDYTVHKQEDGSWAALLNARSVGCNGADEHEAIRNLMNYVAQLCVAGCMDHTGAPVVGANPRRYKAVWPGPSLDIGQGKFAESVLEPTSS